MAEHQVELTPREAGIADLVGQGMTNREIAERFVISVRTVDFHLRNVFKKVGVRSRTELAIQVTRAQMDAEARWNYRARCEENDIDAVGKPG